MATGLNFPRGGGYRFEIGSLTFILSDASNVHLEGKGLTDYKFFCFNGEPRFLYVSSGLENHATAKISFYDLFLNKMPFGREDYGEFDEEIRRPSNFDEMIRLSRELSKGIPFLRVDLYSIGECIYFSELTFSPNAGFIRFKPQEWDEKLGGMIALPPAMKNSEKNNRG